MGLLVTVLIVVLMLVMIGTEIKLINSEKHRRKLELELKEAKARRYILETEMMKKNMLR